MYFHYCTQGLWSKGLTAETDISMIGALPRYVPVLFIYFRTRLMGKRGKPWVNCGKVPLQLVARRPGVESSYRFSKSSFPHLHYRWGEAV